MLGLTSLHRAGLVLAIVAQLSFASASPQVDRVSDGDGIFWVPIKKNGYYLETSPPAAVATAESSSVPRTRKIAIIGAGPSGTSAAYFLKQAQDHLLSLNLSSTEAFDITIYEREQRIGGRTAIIYPYNNDTFDPVELGASIFADVNLNIRRAVKEFKLETDALNILDSGGGQMGIWDGQQFLFQGDQSSWWTSAKFFLRYGYSAITTESIVKKHLAYFLGLYRPSFLHSRSAEKKEEGTKSGYPWKSVEDLAQAVNVTELAGTTGMQFFKDKRVSELFIEEMVEAATRVNYAQDTDRIHGFGALVSLAASGATGVRKGNYKIFEEFAIRSGAKVLKGVEGHVTGIVKFKSVARPSRQNEQISFDSTLSPTEGEGKEEVQWYIGTKSGEGEVYDAVIIATPWHNADITLLNTRERVKGKPFVHLHVTLLTTSRPSPNPEYFGLGSQDAIPTTILTSDESIRRASEKNKAPQGEAPSQKQQQQKLKNPQLDFFSLNYLRSLSPPSTPSMKKEDTEYVVKIFSSSPIPDSLLNRLFGLSTISWIHRHEWDSFPYLTPTDRFPKIQVDEGLYYSNAMESLVSTMETSTVAAKNTVGLLLKSWYGEEFVNGKNCRYGIEDEMKDPMRNGNWAGWGCDSG